MNNVDGQLEFTLASVVGSGEGRSCEVRDSMKRSFKGCMDLFSNIFYLSLIKCKKYNYLLFSFYLIALTQRWMEIEQAKYVYHGWP